MNPGKEAARRLLAAASHCGDPACDCSSVGAVYRIDQSAVQEIAVHGNVYLAIADAVDWLDATGQLLGTGEYLGVVVGVWIAPDDLYPRPSEHPAAKEMLMAVVCDGNGEISIATDGGAYDDGTEATDGRMVVVMRAARAAISRE